MDQWAIADKGEVLADFRSALDIDQRWRIVPAGGAFSFGPGSDEPPDEVRYPEPAERSLLKPDDLTKIWGLGEKAAVILHAAGILIFEQLANITPERLMVIIGETELRARYLQTWPEQAQLAVEGEWDKLAQYKDKLR